MMGDCRATPAAARSSGQVPSFRPILEPSRGVLTLARPISPDTLAMMQGVLRGEAFAHDARVEVASPECSPLVRSVESDRARRYLADDIADLVRALGAVTEQRWLHASLAVITDDMCRKLHSDNVSIRMLCTYAGPGTEWVANEDVVRENLARTDVDVETANRSVLRRPTALRNCEPGEVILLKGDAYPGNEGRGAVHRSPAIRARGLRRLLLKVDEQPGWC